MLAGCLRRSNRIDRSKETADRDGPVQYSYASEHRRPRTGNPFHTVFRVRRDGSFPVLEFPSADIQIRSTGSKSRINSRSTRHRYLHAFRSRSDFKMAKKCGTALDGQTNSIKTNRIHLSIVNPFAFAGSDRRSTARQIRLSIVNPSALQS